MHTPPQVSQDGDVIADIRAAPGSLGRVVAELEALGPTLVGIDADGGPPLQPPSGPASTPGHPLEVRGSTQALTHTEVVSVAAGDRAGAVPRPTLLGSMVGKVVACRLPGHPAR